MKFETLTYQASPADLAGWGSGPETARQISPQGAVGPARFSDEASPNITPLKIVMNFWLWMSGYVIEFLSTLPKRDKSLGQHVVLWPSPEEIDAPLCAIRLNRALARRLRRLARLGRKDDNDFNLLRFQENKDAGHLSPTQHMEWIIRVYRLGRTRVYGLNATRHDLMWAAMEDLGLQGTGACLSKALPSSAPLSPD